MTKTLPELLCSDAWWQDVGPALSPDGRALVKENLTQASAKLDDKEKEKFTEALTALRAPSPEQLACLRDVAAVQTLPESVKILDLSDILICHPDTGAKIFLEGFKFPAARFNGSVFVGGASFFVATFTSEASFLRATFAGEAYFEGATFTSEAKFLRAMFTGEADFRKATFTGEAKFWRATFKGETYFWQATFTGKVNFKWATFTGEAYFMKATFMSEASFLRATFAGKAYFPQATFTGEANFWQTTFERVAYFLKATFEREADFQHTEFLGITIFREAHFKQVANFHAARFSKTVSFRGSDWGAVPDFIGTAWKDGVAIADFEQLQTQLNKGELDWRNPSTSDPAPITDRLQALRKMARDADDRPRELDYFALELQARYQSKGAWAKRFLVSLYGWFSDYGRGVFLPLRGLMELCLLSMLCYWVLADGDGSVLSKDRLFAMTYGVLPDVDWSLWDNALLFSLVNALPPLGASSWVRESILKASYCEEVRSLVGFIAVGEGVIGLILLFLIALGLRNRFRL
jgi:uncharacterized protein YjbI with pentapeptide repeats